MNKLILIGGGGHCKACIDVIELENKYQIAGILDLPQRQGEKILGYKIIASDDAIPRLAKKGYSFLITIGHLGKPDLRNKIFGIVKQSGGEMPVIKSPLAHVSNHSCIKEGTIIMHQVIINADAQIGNNCIINNKALIEHDVIIGNNTHISTSAIINGACSIGQNTLIGSATVLKHVINVGDNIIIGAGSVVTKDILESGVYVGAPAKKIK